MDDKNDTFHQTKSPRKKKHTCIIKLPAVTVNSRIQNIQLELLVFGNAITIQSRVRERWRRDS